MRAVNVDAIPFLKNSLDIVGKLVVGSDGPYVFEKDSFGSPSGKSEAGLSEGFVLSLGPIEGFVGLLR